MTLLRKKNFNLLENISEDYIEEVVHFLENIKIKKEQEKTEHSEAYNNLKKYFGKLKCDIDYKKELQEILIEEYSSMNSFYCYLPFF